MWRQFKPALLAVLWMTLITGLAYPLAVTGIAQAVFPRQASGSLIERDGRILGSELIGQAFSGPGYFRGRPSATAPACNGAASSGSNLGPTNPALLERVAASVAALRGARGAGPVPVDLVTASASGLDPDISPAAALYQVAGVARGRGLSEELLRELVQRHVQPRQLGLLGEPRVNVLLLNLDLDRLARGGASGH